MRKTLLACAFLASCAGKGEFIPTPAPAPETTTSTGLAPEVALDPEPPAPGAPVVLHEVVEEAEAPTTTVPAAEVVEVSTTLYRRPTTTTAYVARSSTPPDYIKQCESGGDYTAVNPNGHYGAWQFSQSTWNSVGGVGRPDHASPAEQDYRASILWAGGAGASHWECA